MKNIKILLITILLILSSFTCVIANEVDEETDFVWLQEEIINTVSSPSNEEPKFNSRYIVAFDRDSKEIIFGKKENQKVPMASTTKIMTAIVLIENMQKSNLTFNTKVETCKQAANIGGSRLGLKTNDKITVNDLLYGLMLCSRK